MIKFKLVKLQDINQIQQIEKEYYEGFCCPEKILKSWIEQLPENFIVAEKNKRLIGFIFFEYFDKIKAVPFIHEIKHKENGKFAYVSEVGILNGHKHILRQLLKKAMEKSRKAGCKKMLWLTGQKHKHDKIEMDLLLQNNFTKVKNVKRWEAHPNHFVSDHWLWEKQL